MKKGGFEGGRLYSAPASDLTEPHHLSSNLVQFAAKTHETMTTWTIVSIQRKFQASKRTL